MVYIMKFLFTKLSLLYEQISGFMHQCYPRFSCFIEKAHATVIFEKWENASVFLMARGIYFNLFLNFMKKLIYLLLLPLVTLFVQDYSYADLWLG